MSHRAFLPALDYLFPENSVMLIPLLIWVFLIYETEINPILYTLKTWTEQWLIIKNKLILINNNEK